MHRLGIREKRNKTDGERHKRQTKKTDTPGGGTPRSPPRRGRGGGGARGALRRNSASPVIHRRSAVSPPAPHLGALAGRRSASGNSATFARWVHQLANATSVPCHRHILPLPALVLSVLGQGDPATRQKLKAQ